MKTGYYNINKLSTVDLKEFFKEAVMLSYSIHAGVINENHKQVKGIINTIQYMIDNINHINHHICIDNSIQNKELGQYGEIGYYKIIDNIKYYLYMFISLENLKELTVRYNLTMN